MSNPNSIRVNFTVIPDFEPTQIVIGDTSSWGVAENLPSYILITPPGSTIAISKIFIKHKLNIFQSVNLGFSCLTECGDQVYDDLPDGVWTINIKSSFEGLEKTRYYLKTDRFRIDLDRVYIRAGLEYDKNNKKIREDLSDIEFLLQVSHSHARNGDFYKSSRDFEMAQNLLKKYQQCVDCL